MTIELIIEADRYLYDDDEWEELLSDGGTLVRCRDCKHYRECEDFFGTCVRMPDLAHTVSADDYCSRGERRRDDSL